MAKYVCNCYCEIDDDSVKVEAKDPAWYEY